MQNPIFASFNTLAHDKAAYAAAVDHLINVHLDNHPSLAPHEVVVEMVGMLPEKILKQVSMPTLSRMMDVMGRHAHETSALGLAVDPKDMDTGYALVCALSIPENLVSALDEFQTRFEARIRDHRLFRHTDLGAPLTNVQIVDFARSFIDNFSESFEMDVVPDLRVVNRPGERSGACEYDPNSGKSTVELNIAGCDRMSTRPYLSLVLNHECTHALSKAIRAGLANTSYLDQDWRTQFALANLFNPVFYTTNNDDVYYDHGEEHLSEAMGVRMAAFVYKLTNQPIYATDFMGSLLFLDESTVGDIIERVYSETPSSKPVTIKAGLGQPAAALLEPRG